MHYFQQLLKFLIRYRHQFYEYSGVVLIFLGALKVCFPDFISLLVSNPAYLWAFSVVICFSTKAWNEQLFRSIGLVLLIGWVIAVFNGLL